MWLKGNLHTHTARSDGDASPDDVVQWYGAHGYDFVALTDHDLTGGGEVLRRKPRRMVVIRGAELSGWAEGKPVHVCALGIRRSCPKRQAWTGDGKVKLLQAMVDWVRQSGGVPLITHPNWHYALEASELSAIRGCRLVEIFNGGAHCNNFAAGGRPSMEQKWDAVLADQSWLWGAAVDDSHHYRREWFGPDVSPPGRGWVVVEAERRSAGAILRALEAGRFYASNEVALRRCQRTRAEIHVEVEPHPQMLYTIELVDATRGVLKREEGTRARFDLRRVRGPVRVRVRSSNGGWAWCQPVMGQKGKPRVRRGRR